ncbi:hypothetical protein FHS16_002619 [Paenibacillus endophyticus]|uniref:Uncharacterized protein n=1 Tax=Paenibacillus endophyticus TaxID=1294268 RepID=A0A7W5C9D5_9BACL|nr:MoaD/ThiS family protein [Paenibacillus endophyticus]MBB3152569.1 hypothetical protein [Paenibacillus endophyticus]
MLNVFITVKSLGKKKNHLDRLAWPLAESPPTLRALIEAVVILGVQSFNKRETAVPLVSCLTQTDIMRQGNGGKVGFGTLYNEQGNGEEEAVSTALLAFEDGLYRVFINGIEAEQLDMPLAICDGDELAFIRFTMLSGGLR